jgi:hypothetical protein
VDVVTGDLAVLILFALLDKAGPEDLCVRRHLAVADINRVEDIVLVLERHEPVVHTEAPALEVCDLKQELSIYLGVRVTHRFAVIERVRRWN